MNFSSMSNEEIWKQFRKGVTAKIISPELVFDATDRSTPGFSWIHQNRVGVRWRLVAQLLEAMFRFSAKSPRPLFIMDLALSFATVFTVFFLTRSWLLVMLTVAFEFSFLLWSQTVCRHAAYILQRHIFLEGNGRFVKRQCVAADDLPPEFRHAHSVFMSMFKRISWPSREMQFVVLDRILLLGPLNRQCVLSVEGFWRGYPVLGEHTVLEPLERENEDEEEPEEDEDKEDSERRD